MGRRPCFQHPAAMDPRMPRSARTPWRSRSTCGTRAEQFRARSAKSRRGTRKSSIPAARVRIRIASRRSSSSAMCSPACFPSCPPSSGRPRNSRFLIRKPDARSTTSSSRSTTPKSTKANSKDFEFSSRSMDDHWAAGLQRYVRTLRHPEVLERPTRLRRSLDLRPRSSTAGCDESRPSPRARVRDAAHSARLSAGPVPVLRPREYLVIAYRRTARNSVSSFPSR